MKSKKIQKVLALLLAMTMIMASAMTVFATGDEVTPGGNQSQGTSDELTPGGNQPSGTDDEVTPGPSESGNNSGSSSSSSHKSSGGSYAATSNVTTSTGSKITSTVSGTYAAESVPGIAFIAPSADIVSAFGLTGKPYAVTTDFSGEASPAAYVSLKHGLLVSGAKELGPVINMNLAQLIGGRVSEIKDNGVTTPVTLAVPTSFVDGVSNYAVIRVRRGGIVDILPDLDLDPATVTVPVTPGTGVYAMIKY